MSERRDGTTPPEPGSGSLFSFLRRLFPCRTDRWGHDLVSAGGGYYQRCRFCSKVKTPSWWSE